MTNKIIVFIAIIVVLIVFLFFIGGCIYQTRIFVPVDKFPSYEQWTIKANAIAFQGSSRRGVGNKNTFYCWVYLWKPQSVKSNLLPRIDKSTIQIGNNRVERVNRNPSFDQTLHFEIPEPVKGEAQELFIPKNIDTISFDIQCTFKNKTSWEETVKNYKLYFKRYESKNVFIPID